MGINLFVCFFFASSISSSCDCAIVWFACDDDWADCAFKIRMKNQQKPKCMHPNEMWRDVLRAH